MKVFSWTTMAVTLLALTGAPGVTRAQQSPAAQPQTAQDTQNDSNRPGQAGQREATTATPGRGAQHAQATQQMDHYIAAVVAIGNEEEIQLSQLAASRAQSDEVKEFARQMQQQHTELGQKLTQITGQRTQLEGGAAIVRGQSPEATERTQQNQQDRDRPSTTSPQSQPGQGEQAGQNQATQGGAGHELHQLIQIKKEIAQRCLQNAEREMQALSGNDFDKAFMGHQAVLHGQMLASLQVYQQHASPQLAQTLAQAEQVTEQHMQHAKKICKQLDSKSSSGSPDRSSTSSDRSTTNRAAQ